jgi:hypothetical protein
MPINAKSRPRFAPGLARSPIACPKEKHPSAAHSVGPLN